MTPAMNAIRTSKAISVLNECLLSAISPKVGSPVQSMLRRVWYGLGRRTRSMVKIRLHGKDAVLNAFNNYPLFSRQYPFWNMPLVELVHQTRQLHGRPIRIVDIGAAVGDTVFLLQANCQDDIASMLCIEGDPDFFPILQENLRQFDGCIAVNTLLSSADESIPSLVRTHSGTASAQGKERITARTFDSVLGDMPDFTPDVIKVDTDGYDGKILAGSRTTLSRHHPTVIFEWHPILCERTSNSSSLAFEVLQESGYTQFFWFDKTGLFSHASCGYDPWSTGLLEAECLSQNRHDWHFDVIALTADHAIDPFALTELRYAKTTASRF